MSNVLLAASHVVLLVDEEVETIRWQQCAFCAFDFTSTEKYVCCARAEGTCLEIFSVYDIFHYDENGTQNNENGTFYPVSQIYFLQR